MERITLNKATLEDWKDYRKIRLEALKNDPVYFGSSYEEEVQLSEKQWKYRICNSNSVIFLVYDDKTPVGLSVIHYESKVKLQHLAYIYSVYVTKKFRGKGISKLLMDSILNDVKKNKMIKKIKLNVESTNKPAISLYKKYGFQIIAILKKEIKIKKKYYDDYIMEKFL